MRWFGWWRDRRAQAREGLTAASPDVRYVVLDTELTGLDPRRDDIVSLGAVRMRGGRLELGGAFHELVRPRAVLDGRSVVIHGITPSQVEDRPPIDAILEGFQAYAAGAVLVGHCVAVDLSFLDREAKRVLGAPLSNPAVDTLSLYGWLRQRQGEPGRLPPARGLSLFDLAEAFDIPVLEGHTALGDACLTAQVFQRLLPLLAGAGVTDLESLLRVGHPDRPGEYLAPGGGPLPL
ncbi:MAG TPA: 3'-5' exonuclease [Holophagaceae bacterium]